MALNEAQREYLKTFVAKYAARSPGSRERRERAWPHLADPRSSIGFSQHAPAAVRELWLATKGLRYPIVAGRCQGEKVWDIDGNQYVDYGLGFGVNLFGHNPEFIQRALHERIALGSPMGFQSECANEVAAGICALTGAERVAFCNTGTEAVMGAIRVARAMTGRAKIVVFAESYHGSHDDVVGAIGATHGISPAHAAECLVLQYGTEESLQAIAQHSDQIAAVLVEPVQARRPDLQPAEYLHRLRALTHERRILLVFDDVLLGFRIHPGGCQAHFDIRADLATYGKVIGGGMPIGVLTGKSEYMDCIDGGVWRHEDESYPVRDKIWFAGTFNKNPLTMATTRAVVDRLREAGSGLQDSLNRMAEQFATRLGQWLTENGMPVSIARFGSMFRFKSSPELTLLIQHLHLRGIFTWEGMVFFLSTAHTERHLDELEQAVKDSLLTMRRGGYIQ
ncbi:MAG TPA: aminotransferase class III-fold pyridoxal phosphate-dependent enzyme [Polyangiaceae bacterium]|nr:aminotransferase class III-fold pyridoxal phosphate-dependent enzyme [Polyangiaceae bacterium]